MNKGWKTKSLLRVYIIKDVCLIKNFNLMKMIHHLDHESSTYCTSLQVFLKELVGTIVGETNQHSLLLLQVHYLLVVQND